MARLRCPSPHLARPVLNGQTFSWQEAGRLSARARVGRVDEEGRAEGGVPNGSSDDAPRGETRERFDGTFAPIGIWALHSRGVRRERAGGRRPGRPATLREPGRRRRRHRQPPAPAARRLCGRATRAKRLPLRQGGRRSKARPTRRRRTRARRPRSTGATSCHGPGQAHVDDDAKGHILKFGQMKPAEVQPVRAWPATTAATTRDGRAAGTSAATSPAPRATACTARSRPNGSWSRRPRRSSVPRATGCR